MKTLVAGNDDSVARELTEMQKALKWEVLQARDAVSATAAILRHRPDAVILFGDLPGGGAVLVLRRLRASVHTTMTPVIAVAGRREGDAEDLRLHGVDECQPPPADPAAIVAWIRAHVHEPGVVLMAPRDQILDPERMAALTRTDLLDSPPDESFDALTRIAAHLLGVPVALVSLVDRDRQFFKSQVGLPEPWATSRETPLTHSFCQWVVADHAELIIDDARNHPVLSDNRALHEIGVIAYAGVPLTSTSGEPLGSLCAIDTKSRHWSEADVGLLRSLSTIVEGCIAVEEAASTAPPPGEGPAAAAVARSVIMRALGDGIAVATTMMQRDDLALEEADRVALLRLIEWFGKQIVRLAGV
jgi:DNA-binding NarL/FixJ family response regulator